MECHNSSHSLCKKIHLFRVCFYQTENLIVINLNLSSNTDSPKIQILDSSNTKSNSLKNFQRGRDVFHYLCIALRLIAIVTGADVVTFI